MMKVPVVVLLFLSVFQVNALLNVHLVCHTHDDVGWLKTVDQYYMGANNSIQHAGVQYVLDSVIPALEKNPDRKFIYVEQAYFQRWWNEQNVFMRERVKTVVAKGQLEFINGGWCMHDEAATHYIAMVDQTTLGHHFIKTQFGKQPTVGWQIDPFGHSLTQASLLSAEVGFNSLFFARIDYQDLTLRRSQNNTEFVWSASASLGSAAQVFTGAFESGGYGPPDGFCFDLFCADPPVQDDPNLEDFNVQDRVDGFVAQALQQAAVTRGNDIMMTMGSDFQYENANEWYKNLDKLINYVNKDGRVNVFYSTPSIYTTAKYKSNLTWSVKTDDFFPYADCPHCYWTGYFTSRTSLKHYVRLSTAYLQSARQIDIFTGGNGATVEKLYEALSVAQHHDGVSGTSKQHVAYDYAKRLSIGWDLAAEMMNNGFSSWANKSGNFPQFTQCTLLNVSSCAGSTPSSNAFAVFVYNPLARSRTEYLRLPVNQPSFSVFGPDGSPVTSDCTETPASSTILSPIPQGDPSPAPYTLSFAVEVDGLGFSTYFVQPGSGEKSVRAKPKSVPVKRSIEYELGQPAKTQYPRAKLPADQSIYIENAAVRVTFDSTTGYLSSLENKLKNLTVSLSQQWFYYPAFLAQPGASDNQNSGAYIFRPNGTDSFPLSTSNPNITVVNGEVIQEIRQTVGDWLAATVRLYGDEEYVEFEYSVGSIPIEDGVGKEVITRWSSSIETAKQWYTDSNGREFQQRVRNFRPTWPLQVNEPIAGNYVPMNAISYIQDSTFQLTVLNDRSQGCGSIEDGQLEVMVQRRLLGDDSRGVGEPLNETSSITPYPHPVRIGPGMPVVGRHFVILETPQSSMSVARPLASRVFSPLNVAFSPMTAGDGSVNSWIQDFNVQGSQSSTNLPVNVELMTLQTWPDDGTSIIRLAHQFAVDEDPLLSQPVTVDLNSIFSSFTISNVVELSLSANQPLSNVNRYQWQTDSERPDREYRVPVKDMMVTLQPMEIRTFQITLTF